jgi:hypothetical protein
MKNSYFGLEPRTSNLNLSTVGEGAGRPLRRIALGGEQDHAKWMSFRDTKTGHLCCICELSSNKTNGGAPCLNKKRVARRR